MAPVTLAAPDARPLKAEAQLRDAVVHPETGRLYAAAYDKDQIWIFDSASGARIGQIPVGDGPCALALSQDGKTLACVNRLAGTVSLIHLDGETVYATLPLGEGACAIAAVGLGKFAVIDSFADAVLFVDPSGAGSVDAKRLSVAVPVALAAGWDGLAVLSRAQSSIKIFASLESATTEREFPGESVQSITLIIPRGLVTASGDTLSILDAKSGKEFARKSMPVSALAADGFQIVVVSNGALRRLDAHLEEIASTPISEEYKKLVPYPGGVVALNPVSRSYQLYPLAGSAAPIVQAAAQAPAAPAPAAPPAVPAPQESPAPAPVAPSVAAEPSEEQKPAPAPAPKTTTAAVVAPKEEEKQAPAAPQKPSAAEAKPAEAKPAAGGGMKRQPLPGPKSGAPQPGRRPSAVPLDRPSPRTITDALLQPTEFGSEGLGFQAPDWSEPLRNVKAGHGSVDFETGRQLYKDNVRLQLGNMLFQSDLLSYSQKEGQFFAQGNVVVEQESSRLTAQDILYEAPAEEALPPTPMIADTLSEQDRQKARLSLGHLHANAVHIAEPTREAWMDTIDYNLSTRQGELFNARGKAGVFYYSASHLRILGPATMEGDDVWVTTCDHDPPHYKIRVSKLLIEEGELSRATNTRLQLGKMNTPLWLPSWSRAGAGFSPWTLDYDTGRRANIGYYLNVGQRYQVSPYVTLGPRIFATEKQGVGLGGDIQYDFMKNPASWLYRTKGEMHGFQTTENRGYFEWYHRYEYNDDLVFRVQAEQWSDDEFYKDFFYDEYRNRTTPRTFGNVTYRQPEYIATGTVRINTHSWANETERLPEVTFHLLERRLLPNLYLTYDTVNGYNDHQPYGSHALRTSNVARLTYDLDFMEALSLTPFVEAEGTWYSRQRIDDESAGRFSTTAGATLQTRFHRTFGGFAGFSEFKHMVVPSITYTYRPRTSLALADTPYFDALDGVFGRSRIETKIDNLFYGRDAETKETWQVGRLTLYQGNDLWNETRKADDYEVEADLRPRPWWGLQMAGERHHVNLDYNPNYRTDWEQRIRTWYEDTYDRPLGAESHYDYSGLYGDYDRVLAQIYYDNTTIGGNVQGRIGFSYTGTADRQYNREILYGGGYRWEKWGIGFEHRYDLEEGNLRSQIYELRRSLHCWETALRFRDRETGFDIDIAFYIKAFPGTRLKF